MLIFLNKENIAVRSHFQRRFDKNVAYQSHFCNFIARLFTAFLLFWVYSWEWHHGISGEIDVPERLS
jgi:hypothetical protein